MSGFTHNPAELPPDLPVPVDDGAAAHVRRSVMPDLDLPTTAGGTRNLRRLKTGQNHKFVVFFYPRTGVPGEPPVIRADGLEWDALAGARGCTPQSCSFRDLHAAYTEMGVDVYGISTSTPEHQLAFVRRNHIPFEMLSDHELGLTRAMDLPTFEWPVRSGGPCTLIRRMVWHVEVCTDGTPRVCKVWYPVFPPDRCAQMAIDWLTRRARMGIYGPEQVGPEAFRNALVREFRSTIIESRGRSFDAMTLTMYVAMYDGAFAGLITMNMGVDELEVVTLQSMVPGHGVGSYLLEAVEALARSKGCRRIFLTTGNENLHAMGFYQRQGWRIVAVHKDAMNAARARNAALPRMAANGILIQDELELELVLQPRFNLVP